MPPEISDEELAKLKKSEEAAEAHKAEVEKERAGRAAERDAYQRDMNTMAAYLRQSQSPPPPPEDPADPEVVEKRKFREELNQGIAQQINPVVTEYYKTQRGVQRQLAKQRDDLKPIITKYSDEVEKMLDNQPINVPAMEGAYEAACKAVAALHMEDIVNERVAAATAPKPSEDDEEEEETTPSRPIREAAVPVAGAATSVSGAASAKRRRKIEPLTSEEQRFAKMFDQDDETYDKYSHGELTEDVFGFRDKKTGKVRNRV